MIKFLNTIIFLIIFCHLTHADYIDLNEVRDKKGEKAGCELAKRKLSEVSNNFEKAYYFGRVMSCEYNSSKFANSKLEEKKKIIKERNSEYANYINLAISNDESSNSELLRVLSVSGEYPKEYEALTKKQMDVELSTEHEVPDVNEGDVHEIGPYIRSSYYKMATSYVSNGMDEDADRIVQELADHDYGGESAAKKLTQKLDVFRVNLRKQHENQKNRIVVKANPKDVTKNLIPSEWKKSQVQAVVDNSDAQRMEEYTSSDGLDKLDSDSFVNSNVLFLLTLIIVFGLYFYRRRKNKK